MASAATDTSSTAKEASTATSSKESSNDPNISKNTLVCKIKKFAMPALIAVGLLFADIGVAFIDCSSFVLGGTVVTSAIGLIVFAILKIKESKK